jgi:hypothetical protein
MGINPKDLREFIIKPALKELGMWSDIAENLVAGTCAVESNMGMYLKQKGGGPALGIYQMEPATHTDIWENFIAHRHTLVDKIGYSKMPHPKTLVYDLDYATKMCRIHYFRQSEPLPIDNSVEKLGQYWKNHYNTIKGAGTVEKFVRSYLVMAN